MKEMLQLFRKKVYARFFLANILERLGSMIAGISLMFYLLINTVQQQVLIQMVNSLYALFGLLLSVTCLYQAILPSGQKRVQGIAEEM